MRVYVAGPITKGDQFLNVRNATMVAEKLLKEGHAPFLPHMTCFWHMMFENSYENWCNYDNQWLEVCDAIIRILGESPGADAEVAYAEARGIPVYYSVTKFLEENKI